MRVKPFTELSLSERRAYLKAVRDFFKPRLNDKKQGADKPDLATRNKRSY